MRRATGIGGVALLLLGAFTLGLLLTRAPSPAFTTVLGGTRDRPAQAVDEVRDELAASYYRAVPAAVLREKTIEGMLTLLDDPYTEHLTRDEYEALQSRTARSYSGVGLTVAPTKEGLVVTSAVNGPALKAGIRRGDTIVSIDGRSARKLPFVRSLALIKGEDGTLVRLRVKRPRVGLREFTLEREELVVPVLRSRLLRAGKRKVGYVRLLAFTEGSAERLERRAAALVRRGARGIVLDLRDNPGGLLSQAVGATSVFVRDGVVCTTTGAHQDRWDYEVSGTPSQARVPLVVLVNGGTASAAEIVAAALRDHRRSLVVGDRTFGKAAVQSVRRLSNGSALKLTTAVYLTPSGRNLTGRGMAPNVKALDDPVTPRDEALLAAKRVLLKQLPRK